MFERPKRGERAVLVHLDFKGEIQAADPLEFEALAVAAGAEVVGWIRGSRTLPDPGFFVGTGKLEEILEMVRAYEANLVLFNHALSPGQERNLERHLKCRVVDRTGLILDIFAQRARTFEGKLQVELAQLSYLSTRLVRGWTHLERQKGGIGLRGPGETQLESDRRVIRECIKSIEKRLVRVRMQRLQGRRARQRRDVPTVVLVGYTNSGKSTLFNQLTQASTYVADQLFATLDPTLRVVAIPGFRRVLVADTVGFVSQLPHTLVEAFKATLEEVKEATLLLHVVDAVNPNYREHMRAVREVLKEIGAEAVPQLVVMNKADLLQTQDESGDSGFRIGSVERTVEGSATRVWISAREAGGLNHLCQAISERLSEERVSGQVALEATEGQVRAQLYELRAIQHETHLEDGGWCVELILPRSEWTALCRRWPFLEVRLQMN